MFLSNSYNLSRSAIYSVIYSIIHMYTVFKKIYIIYIPSRRIVLNFLFYKNDIKLKCG